MSALISPVAVGDLKPAMPQGKVTSTPLVTPRTWLCLFVLTGYIGSGEVRRVEVTRQPGWKVWYSMSPLLPERSAMHVIRGKRAQERAQAISSV